MLDKWIQSVVIKRFVLAFAAGAVSYLSVHAIPNLAPWLSKLAAVGLTINVQVTDAAKLQDAITVALFAATQAAHEYVAARWPDVGKYI